MLVCQWFSPYSVVEDSPSYSRLCGTAVRWEDGDVILAEGRDCIPFLEGQVKWWWCRTGEVLVALCQMLQGDGN